MQGEPIGGQVQHDTYRSDEAGLHDRAGSTRSVGLGTLGAVLAFAIPAVVTAAWLRMPPPDRNAADAGSATRNALSSAGLPAVNVEGSIAARLSTGELAFVDLDACPFDDEGYQETGDPLGVLMCGQTYSAQFDEQAGTWTVIGPDERASEIYGELREKTHTGNGTHPSYGRLTLWGVNLGVRENGEVYQSPDTLIGHIRFESDSQ